MGPMHSDALVFFGATGDLAYKKIFPLQRAFPVIGISARLRFWTMNRERE